MGGEPGKILLPILFVVDDDEVWGKRENRLKLWVLGAPDFG